MFDVILGVICLIVGMIIVFANINPWVKVIVAVVLIIITKLLSDHFGGNLPE